VQQKKGTAVFLVTPPKVHKY